MKLTKHSANPIFRIKENETAFDPYVQLAKGEYRMDFSYREGGACAVAFSSDGISFGEPRVTLTPNEESGWETRVNRNCVIFANGAYRMWYTGQANGRSRIGYAESDDGFNFKRLPHPVLIPEEEYEGESVMNPCVIYEDGIYKMWYSAGENYEPNVICYAESTDGIKWTKTVNNPILEKNTDNRFESDRVGGCQVIRYKDEYLIFYIGYSDIHTACICLARSKDGVGGFERYFNNPILTPTKDSWDSDSCYKPSVIIDEESEKIMLWYNGRLGEREQIGLALGDFGESDGLSRLLEKYVKEFNADDEDVHPTYIKNSEAYRWLLEEMPLLECPDKDIERTYYYRFWTYRKHLKKTEDGYIVTEFLPKVPWSGEHNAIVAPIGHQLYEGRWLKNAREYLGEYLKFMLKTEKTAYAYSNWLAYGAMKLSEISGDSAIYDGFLDDLCSFYEKWELEHEIFDGKFWSKDGNDAMEFSASGTDECHNVLKGIRPTLNSYMCATAEAIVHFARAEGRLDIAEKYAEKHRLLKDMINTYLWRDEFYRAIHFADDSEPIYDIERSPRELIGYIPWMFKIPEEGREDVFSLLEKEDAFYTEYGLATLERSSPRFLYEADHECLWNGYVWPFATSQVLTALYTLIHEYGKREFSMLYIKLLGQFAKSHTLTREDGKRIMWIDESMSPLNGEWYSRRLLKEWGWLEGKGGYERGKDYNHSTFADLVISGLLGISADREELRVEPIILDEWDYFKLENLNFRGNSYTIIYDKSGTRYGEGCGLKITKT